MRKACGAGTPELTTGLSFLVFLTLLIQWEVKMWSPGERYVIFIYLHFNECIVFPHCLQITHQRTALCMKQVLCFWLLICFPLALIFSQMLSSLIGMKQFFARKSLNLRSLIATLFPHTWLLSGRPLVQTGRNKNTFEDDWWKAHLSGITHTVHTQAHANSLFPVSEKPPGHSPSVGLMLLQKT